MTSPSRTGGSRWTRQAPDLEAVKAARPGESPSQFGPGVLELCRQADLVFLALHGACGEDGRVQAAFDLMGIPYTGSGYVGSALAMDKDLTKRLVAPLGVKTPQWKRADYTDRDIDRLTSTTPVPCVVKPVASGSSIGVSIAHTKKELHAALVEGLAYGGQCVLEQYVAGTGDSGGGAGRTRPCPPSRSSPATGFMTTRTSTSPGRPGRSALPPSHRHGSRRWAKRRLPSTRPWAWRCTARADFIVDQGGTPWFLEINTLPGMTPTSLVPQEAAAVGMDYDTLCQTIIDESLKARQGGR